MVLFRSNEEEGEGAREFENEGCVNTNTFISTRFDPNVVRQQVDLLCKLMSEKEESEGEEGEEEGERKERGVTKVSFLQHALSIVSSVETV